MEIKAVKLFELSPNVEWSRPRCFSQQQKIIGFALLITNIINCACHPERLANMTKLISFFLFFNNALYQVHIICFKCYFDVLKLSCKLGSWCAQRQRHKNYSADVRSVKFCQNLDGTHHVKRFFLRKYLYQPLV